MKSSTTGGGAHTTGRPPNVRSGCVWVSEPRQIPFLLDDVSGETGPAVRRALRSPRGFFKSALPALRSETNTRPGLPAHARAAAERWPRIRRSACANSH